ncbi:helicase-related protein [Gaoshiqia sediminis]|uniref:Helicase-related protein n=1 Tax=Gaoshiqia sediminis TaxID=2986998 RepID=A0AA42C432_9BACT|nr:helicase-related protein [Gaoshiqia sediminis]MCW0481353.1 helicase-related protein [Gaoshiqia sediminis]
MINKKRESLIRFLKEQTIGPGAIGFRFIDVQDKELLDQDLKEEASCDYLNEIINNVPGAIYSTGILFPIDRSQSARLEADPDISSDDADQDVEGTQENVSDSDIVDPEALSINQMYPNTMGFTCCVRNENAFSGLKIRIRGRYYKKIQRNTIGGRFGLLLEQAKEDFRKYFDSLGDDNLLRDRVKLNDIGKNTILTISRIEPDEIGELKAKLRDFDRIKTSQLGSDREGQYLSGFKEFLFRKLRYNSTDRDEQISIANKIKEIEETECFISHLNDLLSIFDSRGYGLWKSQDFVKEIQMPSSFGEIGRKTVLNYRKYPEFRHIIEKELPDHNQASLSINVQLSKDSRRQNDNIFIKVQLINTSTEFTMLEGDSRYFSTFNEVVNQRSFFGVGLSIETTDLVPYRNDLSKLDKEEFSEDDVTQILYHDFQDYAIGHGTSVKWSKINNGMKIESEYIPSFDTPNVDPIPKNKYQLVSNHGAFEPDNIFKDTRFLQFKALSTLSGLNNSEVLEGLKNFVIAYENWVNKKRRTFQDTAFASVAKQELDKCYGDYQRMAINIDTILAGTENTDNLFAFRLMNTSMFMQLWHSVNVRNNTVQEFMGKDFASFDDEFYKNANDELFASGVPAAWRPFQLAFILLNLDGIFQRKDDPIWEKRNGLVDLVWFPTGGGKTEAYLGIIALTIINRRKKHKFIGGGTAVLMRYTLRLLTKQQFERASLVIMALELLRRWNKYDLGTEPIYIGLWVGKGSLPNSLDDLEDEYKKIQAAQSKNESIPSNKIPFTKCPWCGHHFNPISFERITDSSNVYEYNRVLLRCSNNKCSFSVPARKRLKRSDHGPIPVSLCDEEIYQHPPALLFGTVDKFAQLAHKVSDEANNRHKDSRRIFGNGNWENGKPKDGYLTPDLIIQDELHLLLGPLGSSVGLFESAIDQLCTRTLNGSTLRPKVISSTATTRNTELQIMALFNRKLSLFPKPGIECDDSFYSFYERTFDNAEGRNPDYNSKRKYLGILPTGRTQMWMQMRLTAILMVHRAIFESKELGGNGFPIITTYEGDLAKAMDNYHTMLTYFNSLREVGKTESQINTYIIKEIRRVFNRVLRPGKMMHSLYTYFLEKGELTGRLSGEEVNRELERVSSKWIPEKRFAHVTELGTKEIGYIPPDVVVATNMISVGIDVSRFNTIIMNSMPRNLAEYIQASSRVARSTYGIVLTVHHPFRARDISHYEKFIEFHEKMYSYVEPISITPFTQKAVTRYLGLYMATMLRHRTRFVNRNSASAIATLSSNQIEELIGSLALHFQEREVCIRNMNVPDVVKNLLQEENVDFIEAKLRGAIDQWKSVASDTMTEGKQLVFNKKAKKATPAQEQLYIEIDEYEENVENKDWQIPQSLRVIEPEAVIKIKSK